MVTFSSLYRRIPCAVSVSTPSPLCHTLIVHPFIITQYSRRPSTVRYEQTVYRYLHPLNSLALEVFRVCSYFIFVQTILFCFLFLASLSFVPISLLSGFLLVSFPLRLLDHHPCWDLHLSPQSSCFCLWILIVQEPYLSLSLPSLPLLLPLVCPLGSLKSF